MALSSFLFCIRFPQIGIVFELIFPLPHKEGRSVRVGVLKENMPGYLSHTIPRHFLFTRLVLLMKRPVVKNLLQVYQYLL
jgi:hypothetical protein